MCNEKTICEISPVAKFIPPEGSYIIEECYEGVTDGSAKTVTINNFKAREPSILGSVYFKIIKIYDPPEYKSNEPKVLNNLKNIIVGGRYTLKEPYPSATFQALSRSQEITGVFENQDTKKRWKVTLGNVTIMRWYPSELIDDKIKDVPIDFTATIDSMVHQQ